MADSYRRVHERGGQPTNNYAYASWYAPFPWNLEREKVFSSLIKQHGKHYTSFTVPQQETIGGNLDEIIPTLQSISKPCGIFAANDEAASAVIMACYKLGIAIPDEVAVLGVDNNVEVCEHLPVFKRYTGSTPREWRKSH